MAKLQQFRSLEDFTLVDSHEATGDETPFANQQHQHHHHKSHQRPQSSLRGRGVAATPWMGITALITAALSAAGIVIALFSATDKHTDSWPTRAAPVQLSVMIATLMAIGAGALRVAHVEGAAISWWVRMLKGSNLYECHRYWEHGMSAWQALLQLHHVNKVSLSSLLLVAVLVAGPLLQRSATIRSVSVETPVSFQVGILTDVFPQTTAYYMSHVAAVNTLTSNFSRVLQDYTSRSPISVAQNGCEGQCQGHVIAPGFEAVCYSSSQPYNLSTMTPGDTQTIGSINIEADGTTDPNILNFTTLFKADSASAGDLTKTKCVLHFASIHYYVRITGNSLDLQGRNTSSRNDTIARHYLPTERAGLGMLPSQLGGFFLAIQSLYNSTLDIYDAGELAIEGTGPLRYTYMTSTDTELGGESMTWMDPMPSILDAIHDLTFRAALSFSNDTFFQSVNGTQQSMTNVYVRHDEYLAGAMAIIAVAMLAITLLFNEYWLLGRRVTLSPLEIAGAFQAPVTTGSATNGEVGTLMKQIGNREVKYGVLCKEETEEGYPAYPRRRVDRVIARSDTFHD